MPMTAAVSPKISVVIVNYKVPEFLCQTIRSLTESDTADITEIIVVDNASHDASESLVAASFPSVHWIGLKQNIGFGKACNVGARASHGHYILFLNPDTIVSKATLRTLATLLDEHPEIGACGPRTLNADGSFQAACRRSFPTPLNSLAYLTGISKLLPNNKALAAYNQNWRDPLQSGETDALSGSCIMMSRSLFDTIGGFDPTFFMYGEDLDLCAQVKKAGFLVWYCAETTIIHFKGKSSVSKALRSRIAFYEAMILFSKKYHHTYGSFFPRWIITLGIFVQGGVNLVTTLFKTSAAACIDVVVANLVFAAIMATRFQFFSTTIPNPYTHNTVPTIYMHLLLCGVFGIVLGSRRLYSLERSSTRDIFLSGLLASTFFIAIAYLAEFVAFSRLSFSLAALMVPFAMIAWRKLLPGVINRLRGHLFTTGNVLVVGSGPVAIRIIRSLESVNDASISGVLWPSREAPSAELAGYPVLGTIADFAQIIIDSHIDLVIIAARENWYTDVVEALPLLKNRKLSIRWVPQDVFTKSELELEGDIPLKNFAL